MEPDDLRWTIKCAEHPDEPPVLAHVGERLGAAPHEIQVRDRALVDHPQRVEPLRRRVDVPAGSGRRRRHEEDVLRLDERPEAVVDDVLGLAHPASMTVPARGAASCIRARRRGSTHGAPRDSPH
jgi:hypothetical protein